MGFFVALEGPDGSGKSTQAHMLASELRARGHTVVETREPGGTPAGEAIRHVLLDPDGPPLQPLTMALLLSASRAQLVADVILPALDRRQIVIADRYTDSTVAYQSYGLGLDLEIVRNLARIATGGLVPDVSIYVDVPVEIGLARALDRGAGNRLDTADLAFHQRVRDGYLRLTHENPERWLSVDGTLPAAEVHHSILEGLAGRLTEVVHAG